MSSRDSSPSTVEPGATSGEDALRQLDQLGARAVLEADVETLGRLYAPDHLLHFAPAGVVRTRQQVLDDVRDKRVLYTSFSRVTEHASLHGDVGVTIGSEVAVPRAGHPAHPEAKRVDRRYTHIWRNDEGRWRLLVRHVNVAGFE
jgi:ketosteroid isomerase-like protein